MIEDELRKGRDQGRIVACESSAVMSAAAQASPLGEEVACIYKDAAAVHSAVIKTRAEAQRRE